MPWFNFHRSCQVEISLLRQMLQTAYSDLERERTQHGLELSRQRLDYERSQGEARLANERLEAQLEEFRILLSPMSSPFGAAYARAKSARNETIRPSIEGRVVPSTDWHTYLSQYMTESETPEENNGPHQ